MRRRGANSCRLTRPCRKRISREEESVQDGRTRGARQDHSRFGPARFCAAGRLPGSWHRLGTAGAADGNGRKAGPTGWTLCLAGGARSAERQSAKPEIAWRPLAPSPSAPGCVSPFANERRHAARPARMPGKTARRGRQSNAVGAPDCPYGKRGMLQRSAKSRSFGHPCLQQTGDGAGKLRFTSWHPVSAVRGGRMSRFPRLNGPFLGRCPLASST